MPKQRQQTYGTVWFKVVKWPCRIRINQSGVRMREDYGVLTSFSSYFIHSKINFSLFYIQGLFWMTWKRLNPRMTLLLLCSIFLLFWCTFYNIVVKLDANGSNQWFRLKTHDILKQNKKSYGLHRNILLYQRLNHLFLK